MRIKNAQYIPKSAMASTIYRNCTIYQNCTVHQYCNPFEGNDTLKPNASKSGDLIENHLSSFVGVTVRSKGTGEHANDISEMPSLCMKREKNRTKKEKKSKKAPPSLSIKKTKNEKKKEKEGKKARLAYQKEENETFREKFKRLLDESAIRLRKEIIDKIDPSA